jgi:serine/threonine-protein phosphatase 4 regulatory subunit 4
MVLELYSRVFFKDYFYDSVLELVCDQVPNVRLKLCPLLPRLKMLIKLPADRNRLQLLEQGVRKILVNETDQDVLEAIDKSVQSLDAVQVPMDSVSRLHGFVININFCFMWKYKWHKDAQR